MEIRKVFRAGNSLVVSLPREALREMGLQEGSRLILSIERDRRALVLQPLQEDLLDIAKEIIDEYRPFPAGNGGPDGWGGGVERWWAGSDPNEAAEVPGEPAGDGRSGGG